LTLLSLLCAFIKSSTKIKLIIYILFVYFVYLDVNIYPSDPLNSLTKVQSVALQW
jgi:hypothetical protein